MSSTQPPAGDYSATTTSSRPPWSEFFDVRSLSLPVSLSDASTQLTWNLTHFRVNYLNIAYFITFLSLMYHPFSLLLLTAILAAWSLLYFSRGAPAIEVAGLTIDDRLLLVALGVITFAALVFANVWINLLVSIVLSAVVVCLHGVLRVSSVEADEPYGGLFDHAAGDYSES